MFRFSFISRVVLGLSFVSLGVVASPAQAGLLNVGGILLPAPAEPDPVGGTVIASQTLPFTAVSGVFSGTLESKVISGDSSNPLGGLTFTYQVTNNQASVNSIGRLSVIDFTGYLTDASYQPSGLIPAYVDRATADVVGFAFAPGIGGGFLAPGATSAVLVVQTNAPAFKDTMASVIDGSIASVGSYGPVPEPATMALLAAGLFGVMRRRR